MPMPDYILFNLAALGPHDVVVTATADPWQGEYPDERTEVVLSRPLFRIRTTAATYWRNGRETAGLWRFWAYPRRIVSRAAAPAPAQGWS